MQEKVEIITNHIVHFWTILDKNTQKQILCVVEFTRLEIKEIRGNTDPVLFSSFKISTENSLPFKLTLLTIDIDKENICFNLTSTLI